MLPTLMPLLEQNPFLKLTEFENYLATNEISQNEPMVIALQKVLQLCIKMEIPIDENFNHLNLEAKHKVSHQQTEKTIAKNKRQRLEIDFDSSEEFTENGYVSSQNLPGGIIALKTGISKSEKNLYWIDFETKSKKPIAQLAQDDRYFVDSKNNQLIILRHDSSKSLNTLLHSSAYKLIQFFELPDAQLKKEVIVQETPHTMLLVDKSHGKLSSELFYFVSESSESDHTFDINFIDSKTNELKKTPILFDYKTVGWETSKKIIHLSPTGNKLIVTSSSVNPKDSLLKNLEVFEKTDTGFKKIRQTTFQHRGDSHRDSILSFNPDESKIFYSSAAWNTGDKEIRYWDLNAPLPRSWLGLTKKTDMRPVVFKMPEKFSIEGVRFDIDGKNIFFYSTSRYSGGEFLMNARCSADLDFTTWKQEKFKHYAAYTDRTWEGNTYLVGDNPSMSDLLKLNPSTLQYEIMRTVPVNAEPLEISEKHDRLVYFLHDKKSEIIVNKLVVEPLE